MDISSSAMQPGRIREPHKAESADSPQQRVRWSGGRSRAADQATISERAQLLRRLREEMDASPDVREEKVAALQEAIEQGRYRPSAVEIAKAILAYTVGK